MKGMAFGKTLRAAEGCGEAMTGRHKKLWIGTTLCEVPHATAARRARRGTAPFKTLLSQQAPNCPESAQLALPRRAQCAGDHVMNECVLIVDDDPVQRRLLENMAQKFGYTAMTAESGEQALRILTRRRAAHRLHGARSRDARSRRPRRARAHARGGLRHAGDRADRAWRHRQCHFRDARGRGRFRGQARERRAPAGLDPQRALDRARSPANCSA